MTPSTADPVQNLTLTHLTPTDGNDPNVSLTTHSLSHGAIEVWVNKCRRCVLRSAWFLEDAEHARGWGDVWNFAWNREQVEFGSLDHELAVWNHSRMWDADALPRVPSLHDECWIVLGYVR